MKLPSGLNLLVVDTETTGANPFEHDLLSVALIPMVESSEFSENVALQEGAVWTEFGKRNFSNFERAWYATAVPSEVAVRNIESYIAETFGGEEAVLIGHNVSFDRFFLAKLAFRARVSSIRGLSHRTVDTHAILMSLYIAGKIPRLALSSDGAFKHFGINVPDVERHTAIGDARATKELFKKLLAEFE